MCIILTSDMKFGGYRFKTSCHIWHNALVCSFIFFEKLLDEKKIRENNLTNLKKYFFPLSNLFTFWMKRLPSWIFILESRLTYSSFLFQVTIGLGYPSGGSQWNKSCRPSSPSVSDGSDRKLFPKSVNKNYFYYVNAITILQFFFHNLKTKS